MRHLLRRTVIIPGIGGGPSGGRGLGAGGDSGDGRHQMMRATQAVVLGGNVRVGLEDSLWIGTARLATSNAEQVARICGTIQKCGLVIATPDQVRAMLQLQGRTAVAF